MFLALMFLHQSQCMPDRLWIGSITPGISVCNNGTKQNFSYQTYAHKKLSSCPETEGGCSRSPEAQEASTNIDRDPQGTARHPEATKALGISQAAGGLGDGVTVGQGRPGVRVGE